MADHLSSQKQLLESSRNVRTLSVMEDQIDSYMEREFTFLLERAREPGINLPLFTFTPLFIARFHLAIASTPKILSIRATWRTLDNGAEQSRGDRRGRKSDEWGKRAAMRMRLTHDGELETL